MHQTIERTTRDTTIIAIMTGHLGGSSTVLLSYFCAETHLQYVFAMQLLQLENVFLTLSASSVIDDLFPSKLSKTISLTPLRTLLCMAAVMCGILYSPKCNTELELLSTWWVAIVVPIVKNLAQSSRWYDHSQFVLLHPVPDLNFVLEDQRADRPAQSSRVAKKEYVATL